MNGIPPLSSRDAHASPPQRVLERLHSSAAGLDADEAARRLAAHGYNRLPAPKRQGPLLRLLRQFHNVLLYMMLFASLVTALLGFWVDSAVILLAVVVNALIGFVQEGKAANALDAIRDMLSLHALVLRDGQRQALDAERLVPGDVVLLASGDRVPADLRLFETKNFHVDESALTGESVPVEKGCVAVAIDALLGDRRCMAYSGTLVTSGQARGVVVATAGDTELGRIGTLLREVRTLATPLLRQIASFSRWLALAILLLAGATFVLGTLWQGQPMVDMFMLVVALTASAIPEGLPAIMTVILALGVQRMARRNAIVSRLPAVETLGSVTVICSDKTGTLTRNEMTVQRIVTADQVIEVSGAGYAPLGGFSHNGEGLDPAGRDDLQEIGRAALLCNEARLHQEGEAWQLEGDPTEGALLSLGLKLGLDPQALAAERNWPRNCSREFSTLLTKLPLKATTRNRQMARNNCLSSDIQSSLGASRSRPSARILVSRSCQRDSFLLSPVRRPPSAPGSQRPSALKAYTGNRSSRCEAGRISPIRLSSTSGSAPGLAYQVSTMCAWFRRRALT